MANQKPLEQILVVPEGSLGTQEITSTEAEKRGRSETKGLVDGRATCTCELCSLLNKVYMQLVISVGQLGSWAGKKPSSTLCLVACI